MHSTFRTSQVTTAAIKPLPPLAGTTRWAQQDVCLPLAPDMVSCILKHRGFRENDVIWPDDLTLTGGEFKGWEGPNGRSAMIAGSSSNSPSRSLMGMAGTITSSASRIRLRTWDSMVSTKKNGAETRWWHNMQAKKWPLWMVNGCLCWP